MFPTIERRLEAYFRRQSAFAVSSAYLFGSYADGAVDCSAVGSGYDYGTITGGISEPGAEIYRRPG